MNLREYKKALNKCWTEIEARRLFHYEYPRLVGTQQELFEAIALTDARCEDLADNGTPCGRRASNGVELMEGAI